ncbi:hypothetical protein AC578_7786 [Pseudocercospora eumusae]|uniref:Uncharacterized protein n=1 Tax=Pseudocercospora eumusae TaxID=321146 RepID=A0A139H0Y2_9PEZI|nr:hypothetical protein AC578_7786 [Pseudocercospora eumusae]
MSLTLSRPTHQKSAERVLHREQHPICEAAIRISDADVAANTTYYLNESVRDPGIQSSFPDHVRGVAIIPDSGLASTLGTDKDESILHMMPIPKFLISTLC